MKRKKKAKVLYKMQQSKIYSVQCPHCGTLLEGMINENILAIKCYYCKNPIELIFPQKVQEYGSERKLDKIYNLQDENDSITSNIKRAFAFLEKRAACEKSLDK